MKTLLLRIKLFLKRKFSFKHIMITNCPFHLETTPSYVVDIKAARYHCFGCGKSGKIDQSNFICTPNECLTCNQKDVCNVKHLN